jgi:glycosyltransferase involved in cell wall biosynthesis
MLAHPGDRCMLSVVIPTQDSEGVLLPTLAALVSGAAAGIVREVIVADAGSQDATAEIADVAGCRLLLTPGAREARLTAAAAVARGPWLLFLQPGIVPDATWVDETRRFVEEAELRGLAASHAAVFRPAPTGIAWRPGIAEAFGQLLLALGARPKPEQGLLISKRLFQTLGGYRDGAERQFLRRLGRRRIVMLRTGTIAVAQTPLLDSVK